MHQVLASACAGDAATDRALALRTRLRAFGPSDIYAVAVDPSADDVLPLRDLPAEAAVYAPEATDLVAGHRGVVVTEPSPLVFDADRLRGIEPHGPTAHHLAADVSGPLLVGTVSSVLVEAFHVLVTYLDPDVRLALLGPATDRHAVQLFVHELNLAGAWLTGPLTEAERVAYYRRADAFVAVDPMALPALDAMALGVPVVAVPDPDPRVVAEALVEVLHDAALRARLVEQGGRRAAAAAGDDAAAAFVGRLVGLG